MTHPDPIPRRKARSRGFSLIEVFFVAAIGVIVVAALMTTFVFVVRSFRAVQNYDSLNVASRNALDLLSRDVRNAAGIAAMSSTSIVGTNADTSSFGYQWDSTAGTFTRCYTNASGTTATTTLLTGCDTLGFLYYIRIPGKLLSFQQTTDPSQVKLINVSWRCFRQIYGFKINTESVQTAQIVCRN